MNKHKDHIENWERLVAYITGECTKQEEDEIRARLAVDEDQAHLLQEIRAVWKATERKKTDEDISAEWRRFNAKLRGTTRIHDLPGIQARKLHSKSDGSSDTRIQYQKQTFEFTGRRVGRTILRSRSVFSHLFRVAAALTVLVTVTVVTARLMDLPGSVPTYREPEREIFTTNPSERALVRLNDGTNVRLNVGSKLVVPARFSKAKREIYLEGEAYFDVVPDSLRPFIVRTGDAHVEVLGTEFNIWAYPQEHAVEVVVANGEVALSRNDEAVGRDTVVLRARQLGRIQEDDDRVVRRDRINLDRYLVWMSERLVFDNASIDEVVRVLERRHNVKVELRTPTHAIRPLNVTFERESLDDMLKVIAATLNLSYTWKDGKVIFFPAPTEME